LVLSNAKRQEPVSLSFDVEGEQIDCDLTESAVMAAGLKEKFFHIMSLVGACDDGSTVTITINSKQRGTFHAGIYKDGVQFYAYTDAHSGDNDDEVLSIFRYSDIQSPEGFEWSGEDVAENIPSSEYIPSSLHQTDKAYKFRIAVIATKQYSNLHGDTIDSVLTEIVTVMAVVNGIYLREVGVMFELIDKNNNLICISSDNSDVCNLENDNQGKVLAQAADFIRLRNVTSDEYDIGHTFIGSAGGGLAELGSLCDSNLKAMGTTGVSTRKEFIDYLAHELGHQLNAGHSFRDCEGENKNRVDTEAVEPGSGTTIMSYAGICNDGTNVQEFADPHFNSLSLEIIRSFVELQGTSCGTSVNLDTVAPVMNTKATCTVPKGNYVQLSGRVDNIDQIASDSVYFAWDRIDPGAKEYLDKDVPRFVPQTPTTRSMKRFLPNLYILSYDVDTLKEIAPKATVPGDEIMKFRFVGRTSYDKDATPFESFDSALVGRFGYTDMILTYSKTYTPLKFDVVPRTLVRSETVQITWTGGATLTDKVEILVAVNTMVNVGAKVNFDDVVEDLEWESLGTFRRSDEVASITIPSISNPRNRPLNIMIRSVALGDPDDDDCYFFDMKSGLQYTSSAILPPTTAPTYRPTPSPTNRPTNRPTSPAIPAATNPPSHSPTKAPTPSPTLFPTLFPTKAPTEYYNQVYNYYNQGYNDNAYRYQGYNYNQGYNDNVYRYQGYNQGYNGYQYQGYNQGYNGNEGYNYRQSQPQQGWGNDAWGSGGNQGYNYNIQPQQGYGYGGVRYGGGQQENYYNQNQYNHQRYGGYRRLAEESTDEAIENEAEMLPKAQRKLLRVSGSSASE
jgi:hypothetical protein